MLDQLRTVHRQRVSRLQELSVEVKELSAEQSQEALLQFATAFIGLGRTGAFLAAVKAAQSNAREIDYGKWLWQGAPPPPLKPRFGWLSDWWPGRTCIRFDRRVALPALHLPIAEVPDEWVLSWPGVYVCFDTSRTITVSLDYEVMYFDLQRSDKSPYR